MRYSELDLAYFAGIFDGEGCVVVHTRENNRGYLAWQLQIQVSNTDGRLMNWIENTFGGSVYIERPAKKNYKQVYRWTMQVKKNKDFLADLYKHLRIKKFQVEALIELLELPMVGGKVDHEDREYLADLIQIDKHKEHLYQRKAI